MDNSFTNLFLDELEYFINKKGIILLAPANKEDIQAVEKILDCEFSPQMSFFLTQINGARIKEVIISGVQSLRLRKLPNDLDIVETNQFLRTYTGWNPNLIEIGVDGFGCLYVIDTSRKMENGEYPVSYLDHEDIGEDKPLREYAAGYFDFLLKVIGEMKRIYTQSGDLYDLEAKS
jgi:hypothetical protein